MPAIMSFSARDIRTGDTVTLHDDREHYGEVTATTTPNAFDVNIVIDCIAHGADDQHPAIELHKRSQGALVTAERTPRKVKAAV